MKHCIGRHSHERARRYHSNLTNRVVLCLVSVDSILFLGQSSPSGPTFRRLVIRTFSRPAFLLGVIRVPAMFHRLAGGSYSPPIASGLQQSIFYRKQEPRLFVKIIVDVYLPWNPACQAGGRSKGCTTSHKRKRAGCRELYGSEYLWLAIGGRSLCVSTMFMVLRCRNSGRLQAPAPAEET